MAGRWQALVVHLDLHVQGRLTVVSMQLGAAGSSWLQSRCDPLPRCLQVLS